MSIPRRIIQTHRNPDIGREWRQTWINHHPGYEYLFFDNAACRDFVATHRPELLAVYDKLPANVQRADMFRYLAVHELGGMYADVDTICDAPLHSYIDMNTGHLVAGMEMTMANYPHGAETYMLNYAAPYQVLNWAFAAPKGHPALQLMLRRIEYYVSQMSEEQLALWTKTDRFTLEITGPMAFTHVLNEFLSSSRQGAVTVLPRMTWGSLPEDQKVAANAPNIKLRHLFEGYWKNPAHKVAKSYELRL